METRASELAVRELTTISESPLMVVYGYLMFFAAKSLSDGSETLLEILGSGFVAGLVLPILGALPDAMLVLGAR
nr:hypothetical protein CFP56_27881 [Quercus suber]